MLDPLEELESRFSGTRKNAGHGSAGRHEPLPGTQREIAPWTDEAYPRLPLPPFAELRTTAPEPSLFPWPRSSSISEAGHARWWQKKWRRMDRHRARPWLLRGGLFWVGGGVGGCGC